MYHFTSLVQFLALFHDKLPGHSALGTFVAVEGYSSRNKRRFRHVWDEPAHFPHGSHDVYFTPGRFNRRKRTQDNFAGARALWTDLDVDPTGENKGKYLSQRAALDALKTFCEDLALPRPLIVLSGVGVQAFFVCTEFLDAPTWNDLAVRLRAAMDRHQIRYDPSRATDSASVMRTPFTVNSKNNAATSALPFKETISLAAFRRALAPFTKDGYLTPKAQKNAQKTTVNNFLTLALYTDATADAIAIADRCEQVAFFRENPTEVSEPVWYHNMQLLRFCKDGNRLAHEWSAPDPRYNTEDLEARWLRLEENEIGPTTCDQFRKLNPKSCQHCRFSGKIKTPIVLGRNIEPAPAEVVETRYNGGVALPKGFTLAATDDNALCYRDPATGSVEKILDGPLIVQRHLSDISREGSEYRLVMVYRDPRPDAVPRRIEMGLSLLKAPEQMKAFLAGHNVIPDNTDDPILALYLQRCIRDLTQNSAPSVAYSRAGWGNEGSPYERNFLIQDKMLGEILEFDAVPQTPFRMACKGALPAWLPVFTHYMQDATFPFRTAFLAGFAAPLMRFTPSRGVAIALVSEQSGVGKSLVQQVTSAIWSSPDALVSQKNDTITALYKKLGALNSLPFSVDEATHMDALTIKDMVFSISSGHEKARVTRAGDDLQHAGTWRTIALFSANHSLADKIAEGMPAAGETARLMELKCEVYATQAVMRVVGRIVTDNYGYPGLEWARYIAMHQDEIGQHVNRVHDMLTEKGGFTSSERYYKDAFAACIVAAFHLPRAFAGVKTDGKAYMHQVLAWARNRLWTDYGDVVALSGEDVQGEMLERRREQHRLTLSTRVDIYTRIKVLQERNTVSTRVLDAHEIPTPDAQIVEYRHDGTILVNKALADENKIAPGRTITVRGKTNSVKYYQYGDHEVPDGEAPASSVANIVPIKPGVVR